MKNFIFKSDADFHKILFNKLDMTLLVMKQQRVQLDRIEYFLKKLVNSSNLQKQVDEYFDEADPPSADPPEDTQPDGD